jgi:hypothetical protein
MGYSMADNAAGSGYLQKPSTAIAAVWTSTAIAAVWDRANRPYRRLTVIAAKLVASGHESERSMSEVEMRPGKKGHTLCLAFRISPARSPIMTQGAIVLPVVTRGIMEPSAIRRLSMPWTLREPSTTDIASCPILAVHV